MELLLASGLAALFLFFSLLLSFAAAALATQKKWKRRKKSKLIPFTPLIGFHWFHSISINFFHQWRKALVWCVFVGVLSLFAEHWRVAPPITHKERGPPHTTLRALRRNSSPFISFMSWTVPLGGPRKKKAKQSILPIRKRRIELFFAFLLWAALIWFIHYHFIHQINLLL